MLAVVSCWAVAVRPAIKVMDRNQLRAEERGLGSVVQSRPLVRSAVLFKEN